MKPNQLTLRVTDLPSNTTENDVKSFFDDRIQRSHGKQVVETVGPVCSATNSTRSTTVSFSSHNTAQKALKLKPANRRLTAVGGGASTLNLDDSFLDLTTIHYATNPETGKPDIDIVALHGLTGHAWNTFATSEVVDQQADRRKDNNWLRDNLPRLLEHSQQGPVYCRVMTYGYNADVWMTNSNADLDVPVRTLLWSLEVETQKDPHRPLFFIGHSLGGIVIKQAITTWANEAIANTINPASTSGGRYLFPIKGCLFFGVPHKGADIASTASNILNLLSLVFDVNRNNVHDLEAKSQRFANISSEFKAVRNHEDIPILSFFETMSLSRVTGVIVNEQSAVFDYDGAPRPFGLNRDHREMTKFSRDNDQGMSAIVHFIANRARDAIAELDAQARAAYSTPLPQHPTAIRNKNEEDKFAILKQCDTVFLVDDSPSMRGRGWELVQHILEHSMTVATWYDRNGIDLHFFNDWDSNQNELSDPEKAIRVLKNVDLNGDSPLYDQLCRHLDDYWSRFEKDGRKVEFKNYNLIILTDGEPKEEYESSDEISDQEDARKNKAAFRMIRKKIVDVARQLDKANARKKQIGIQFCQIGDDRDANVFFHYLDNDIKGNYKLKRDMVDTIKCVSELDLTPEWYEKLLLGGIDKRLDHEHVGSEASNSRSPPRNGASNRMSIRSSWSLPNRTKSTSQGFHRSMTGDETLVGSPAGHVNSMPNISSSRLQTLPEAQQANYPATISEQFEQSPPRLTYADRQRTFPNRLREPEAGTPQPQRSETFQPQKSDRSTSWRPWSRG